MSPFQKLLTLLVVRWRIVAGVVGTLIVLFGVLASWRISGAVRQARARHAADSTIRFSTVTLDRVVPTGIESIGAPSVFRDAAVFQGHLFVVGPHGLAEYEANGTLRRRFRAGLELPPAGLVSVVVGALAADSEPSLIIGTGGEGLLVFDGRRLRHVRPERAAHRKVTALLALGSGRVLFGTAGHGLLVYDGRRLTPAHPSFGDVSVTALAGTEGDVWVGTSDRGVLHWRAGEVDRFGENDGLPDRRVLSIAAVGEHAYIGTAIGVAEFTDGRYVRTVGAGLFASAVAVRGDTLFVGTIDDTVAEIPLLNRASRGVRSIVQDAPVSIQRFVDGNGVLLAVGDNAVYALNDGATAIRQVIAPDRAQLTDRNVSALAIDQVGRVWVGYFDRGLDILTASGERTVHAEGDRVFCVNRIVHDRDGGLTAVATANGLVLFDSAGRQKQVLGKAQGLIADHVTDLILTGGRMTVATPAGLTFIDPDGSRSLYAFHGLVNNHVYALAAAGSQLLAGTLGGASLLDNGTILANYTTANSALTHNWITAIARVDDEWFAGTYGGGLFRLDAHGAWQPFADSSGAIEINPNAMVVTDTHVFAGSLSSGLLVYDRQAHRWSTFETGLPSTNVTALAAASGSVYVGTDNGLVRIAETAFPHP